MTRHEFIFSNSFGPRLARHAAFCFACYVFFCVVFYIPFGVFPAWNTELFSQNSSRLGFPTWLKWRVVNSTLTFLPIITFAYCVIYFVLPRYYFSKKNPLVTTFIFAGILILIFCFHYANASLLHWNLHRVNPAASIPNARAKTNIIIKGILFNYPILTAFAVIIKMMKRSWLKQQETIQVAREKAKAELQLLKAQIQPHFLFNTLNNIYFFTLTSPQRAPEMLIKLTDMLRYIINECGQPFVPLEKEIKMIEDYMALEKIRYGDRLKMDLEIKGDYSNKMISPLLLIPLVENSFKHGASKMLEHPWVNLNITISGQYLLFLLSNSRPDVIIQAPHSGHIGLSNVQQRLQLLYPAAHELSIVNGVSSFEIFMKISLAEAERMKMNYEAQPEPLGYELA